MASKTPTVVLRHLSEEAVVAVAARQELTRATEVLEGHPHTVVVVVVVAQE